MLKRNEFKCFCLPTFMSVELRQRKKIMKSSALCKYMNNRREQSRFI